MTRFSPLLRLGALTEKEHFGFSWRKSVRPIPTKATPSSSSEAFESLRRVLGEYADWQGYRVSANLSHVPAPVFGFHTKSAETVWKHAQRVADAAPKETTAAIVSKAIDRSEIPVSELTPEDMKMLDMAVNWYLAGKVSGMEQPFPPPFGGNATSGTQKNFPDSGSL